MHGLATIHRLNEEAAVAQEVLARRKLADAKAAEDDKLFPGVTVYTDGTGYYRQGSDGRPLTPGFPTTAELFDHLHMLARKDEE